MKILRLHLHQVRHTTAHGMRDEYDAKDFVIEPNPLGYVEVTRRNDGATVAYPRESCTLVLESRKPAG